MRLEAKIWMPHYIGDYLADTIGLSRAEHGSYMLSRMAYWRKGGPLTTSEMKDVLGKDFDRISKFFTHHENHWHHSHLQEELQKAALRMKSAREKAAKGVAGRVRAAEERDDNHQEQP